MRWEPDPERRYLVCAVTGDGKSTFVGAMASAFRGRDNLVVLVDPKRDAVMRRLQPMASASVRQRGGGLVRLVPDMDPTQREAPCSDFCEPLLAQIFRRGNCTVVIDELQMVATQHRFPPSLNRIYCQGRARKISVISVTTEPVRIPMWVRGQSLTRIIGHVGEGGQRDYCADLLWMERSAFRARMDALPRYHFLWRSQEWVAAGRPAEEVWTALRRGA